MAKKKKGINRQPGLSKPEVIAATAKSKKKRTPAGKQDPAKGTSADPKADISGTNLVSGGFNPKKGAIEATPAGTLRARELAAQKKDKEARQREEAKKRLAATAKKKKKGSK